MKAYIPLIIIIVLLFVIVNQCKRGDESRSLADTNRSALIDTVTYYTNALGTKTAGIATLQLEKSELTQLLLNRDKELSALSKDYTTIKHVTKYKTVTEFDTIQIAYADTVPCVFECKGSKKDVWYSFNYASDQNGVVIDSLKTTTETTVICGFKRRWLLGSQILTTDITNSNPHLEVTGIKAAEILIPVPWYKKWYMWLAAGIAGGIIMAK